MWRIRPNFALELNYNFMKTRLSILLLSAAIFGLTACSVNDEPVVIPETPENSETTDNPQQPEPDYASVRCDAPVFVSYNIQSEVRTPLESFLTNITSIDEAEVAVIKAEDIGAYEDKLKDLYDRGGLVVVVHPTSDSFAAFAEKHGISNYMPTESSQPILLFATDNNHHHYALYANGPFDGNYNDDVTEYVPDEPISEEIREPELESEETYYKRRIFQFFRWIKQERKTAGTRGTAQWVATYDPYLTYIACEHIYHNFEIPMNHAVYQVIGYSEDYINATGSIDVRYDIYNAYVFSGVSNPGDYYIVTRSFTVHNGDAYQPFNRWHGGIKVWGHGYFMEDIEMSSRLLKGDRTDLSGAEFAVDPTPSSTVKAASYSSGYSFNLDGSLSAGSDNGISLGFGASYSNSVTKDISDLEIEKQTDSSNRKVTYKYTVKNILESNIVLFTWNGNDKLTNDIPIIARSDFDAVSDWCWFIPIGTNDVGDYKTTKFQMLTSYNTHYGCHVRNSAGGGGNYFEADHEYTYEGACYQTINAPNREPFGIMNLQNGHNHKMGNIRIWKQGEQGDRDKVFYQLDHSIKAGKGEDIALPVGTYYIEYCQQDGNNNVLSTWKLENVSLHSGNTRDAAATIASTENAAQIK